MTHASEVWVETVNASPSTGRETHISEELKRRQCNQYILTVNGLYDQGDKQTQPVSVPNMEETDWQTEVKLSDKHITYRAKFLNMLPEF